MFILGIDEAGRGPIIGPLVMCGVVVDEEKVRELVNIGVKDSKLLLPKKRREVYDKLFSIIDSYHVVIVEANEIDEVIFSASSNLNKLEAKTSAEIISKLKADQAILDCPSPNLKAYKFDVETFLGQKKSSSIRIITKHKADVESPIVGAASIIAKVTRDSIIDDLKEKYCKDFGSGYLTDPKTTVFLEENWDNPEYLLLFRKSWGPWQKRKYNKEQTNLNIF